MLKKAVATGSTFIIVGVAVLVCVQVIEQRQQQKIVRYKAIYGAELTEQLRNYDRWINSPEDELTFLAEAEKLRHEQNISETEQQKQRLAAHQDELTALDESAVTPFADVLYGANWREELEKRRSMKEMQELALTGSVILLALGSIMLGWSGLVCCARVVGSVVFRTSKRSGRMYRWVSRFMRKRHKGAKTDAPANRAKAALMAAGGSPPPRDEKGRFVSANEKALASSEGGELTDKAADETSAPETPPSEPDTGEMVPRRRRSAAAAAAAASQGAGHSLTVDTSSALSAGAPDAAMSTLNELSEQVLAIRQYVACQHDKVERMQDGHHWSAIRALCLRVIRCIDNIDDRMSELPESSAKESRLKDVRDELLFALESSGVEQYVPEVNEEYRGQEKYAEAIKEREPSEDDANKGKIAKVIRPGYQYFIDDDHAKVVRTAQVKIYG